MTKSNKQKILVKAHEIFKRARKKGSLSNKYSIDSQEVKDAHWIYRRKEAKANKGTHKWFPELDEMAKEYGFPKVFDMFNKKQIAIDKAHEILKRAKDRGSLPKKSSKDRQEVKDAGWVGAKRQAKSGRSRGIWYPVLDQIAKQYGFVGVFDKKENKTKTDERIIQWERFQRVQYKNGALTPYRIKKLESSPNWYWNLTDEAVKMAHKIFKKAKEKGSLPKKSSKDPQEVKYGSWIHMKKMAKAGRSAQVWYTELDEIAKSYGFPDAFNYIDKERIEIDKAYEIFKRAKKRNSLPRSSCKDKQELKDYSWFNTRRQIKAGKKKRMVWFPVLDKIAREHGFIDAFNVLNLEQSSINRAHEIFKKAQKKGRLPSQHSKNKQEKKDGLWIQDKKKAKNNKKNMNWYPALDDIADQYGFSGVFDKSYGGQRAINDLRKVLQRIQKRGCLPKGKSKDPQEVKDSIWINSKRQTKAGRGKSIWYPELDKIAEQYGFPNIFDIKKRYGSGEMIDKAHEVLRRTQKRGCLPKSNSEDLQEVKDASWFNSRRQSKMGKGSSIWYTELDKIAKQYGFPSAFNKQK